MPLDPAAIETIKARFPGALIYLNNPEVAALLERAVAEEWAPETFDANLRATQWYIKTTDSQRTWYSIESGNPGEASTRVNARKQQIKALAYQLGQEISDNDAGAHAWQSLREGWSEQDLRYNVATLVQPAGTSVGATDVRQLANEYMITLTDDKLADLSRRAFAGQLDENGLRSMFAAQAAGQFPGLADQIKAGTTPGDYFDPYKQQIAKYTDTPPGQVDMNSATWRKIVSYASPDGKVRPMTLDEAIKYIRSTDEFANSTTGKQETANYQVEFEKMFGARR